MHDDRLITGESTQTFRDWIFTLPRLHSLGNSNESFGWRRRLKKKKRSEESLLDAITSSSLSRTETLSPFSAAVTRSSGKSKTDGVMMYTLPDTRYICILSTCTGCPIYVNYARVSVKLPTTREHVWNGSYPKNRRICFREHHFFKNGIVYFLLFVARMQVDKKEYQPTYAEKLLVSVVF